MKKSKTEREKLEAKKDRLEKKLKDIQDAIQDTYRIGFTVKR
jgi:hypothetical protein